jgi:chromosome segregation protein
MPLSSAKRHRATACLLLAAVLAVGGAGSAFAADPPDAQMAAAGAAVAAAERAQARGDAGAVLGEARARLAQAQDAAARRKYRDAARLAEEAQASAELALAMARHAAARQEVDEKQARNVELRRRLLVLPEDNG